MIKKLMWLSTISIMAIAFSVNAFAMMGGSNGYNNHTQQYGYNGSHMSDYGRSLYNGHNYINPDSNYSNSLNGSHNNSRVHGYSKSHQNNYQRPYRDNKFRGNYNRYYNRNINPHGERYGEDYLYQWDLDH